MATADVLVIGAGPAGIASAYYLSRAGIRYIVIDRAPVIAATWHGLYPSLRLNTTRFFSHLPGKRFPLSYGLFPTGRQYHAYLEHFAAQHRLNIQLGASMLRARQHDDGWCVETSAWAAWFPAVIAATGRFCSPIRPHFSGEGSFEGELLHACDYRGPDPFRDKRVMVVGNGPSGIDIATELGRYSRHPVLLAQRTGVKLSPRYPYGLPKHLWMLLGEYLPAGLRRRVINPILDKQFTNVEALGIRVPHGAAESTAAGATRGRELIDAVRAGRVRPVAGPARFDARSVELTDGARYEVDAVILATGYRPALFEYLDLDVGTNPDGWPLRVGEDPADPTSGRREIHGYPGLYLVGTFYQGKGAMYNINVEAQAAVAEIGQRLSARALRPLSEAAEPSHPQVLRG